MVFGVAGGSQLDTSYEIQNSARFDNAGGSALGIQHGTATNSKKFTLSFWYKICSGTTSGGRTIWGGRSGYENIFIHEDTIRQDWNNASSGTVNWAPLIRDQSAWYHFVVAQDTSQSTDSNRAKLYINGVQAGIRSGVTLSYPSLNLETGYNVSGVQFYLSSYNGSAGEVNAYYADVYFVDGQQYEPTVFGEFNDNGVWVPKEAKNDVAFGNNGFFLEFQQTGTGTNSSGIGADTSGNDNHLSVTGLSATDICTDTPTNNFAVMNPNDNYYAGQSYSEGNCRIVTGSSQSTFGTSTLGVANGKWYWEVKIIDKATGSDQTSIGIQGGISPGATSQIGYNTRGQQLRSNGNTHTNGGNSTYMASLSDNDIVMVAFDRDNNSVYFGANGQWGDGSGNTDEANPTSAKGISVADDDFVFAALGDMTGSDTCTYEINFGNPPFSISSGNADANGHGNFEYAVPSGYFALCTKNLAENG